MKHNCRIGKIWRLLEEGQVISQGDVYACQHYNTFKPSVGIGNRVKPSCCPKLKLTYFRPDHLPRNLRIQFYVTAGRIPSV